MKNLFVICGLILGVMATNHMWAQDDADSGTTISIKEASKANGEKKSSARIRFDLDFDDDESASDDENIEKLTKLVGAVGGKSAAKELELEIRGMSPEEKAELREALRDSLSNSSNFDHVEEGIAVAIVAIIATFSMPVLIVIVVLFYRSRRRKEKMQLINTYLESGKDVPPEVLRNFGSNSSTDNSYRSGVMLCAVGLGIISAFYAMGNDSAGALGLIPFFIGLAKLLFWYIEERAPKDKG